MVIRSTSAPLVTAAESDEGSPADADRAAAELRRDFERWSRWGLGVLAFVLASVGSFVAVGLVGTVAMLGGAVAGVDLIATVVAALVGVAGIVLLLRLWWTGRRLVVAAAWWLRLPYLRAGRQRRPGGWVQARTINFEPRIFARLATATLALLFSVAGVALVVRDLGAGLTSFTAATAMVAVISGLSGLGQVGGVARLVSGVSELDPLWVRVRSLFAGADRTQR
uniref:hypothetical protein n=1 Tax=Pseudoclavibacter sp. RFBI5 TaxID=2080578 RepID=UPI0015E46EFC|nr:hypothetical protein [Pseudoclavibacter sp. RFBI5]